MGKPWLGVDLDGTLAHYTKWRGIEHIGNPIPAMLARVKRWLADGRHVKIFTARVSSQHEDANVARKHIESWCIDHLGRALEVTAEKDGHMVELWDDRAVQVEKNTGRMISWSRFWTKDVDD